MKLCECGCGVETPFKLNKYGGNTSVKRRFFNNEHERKHNRKQWYLINRNTEIKKSKEYAKSNPDKRKEWDKVKHLALLKKHPLCRRIRHKYKISHANPLYDSLNNFENIIINFNKNIECKCAGCEKMFIRSVERQKYCSRKCFMTKYNSENNKKNYLKRRLNGKQNQPI